MDLQPSTTESDCIRIDADLLIPGRAPPLKDATWILRSRTIVHVGLRSSLPDEYTSLPAIQVPTLFPGRPDLIAVKRNPLGDTGVWAKAEDVSHVWRAGKLYKSPEMKCGG